jgi:hypothetical protein
VLSQFFLDGAPNPFRAHGSEPKGSLEDNHSHSYVNRFSVLFIGAPIGSVRRLLLFAGDHNSYRRWKYATFTCLGWIGLLAFVVGFSGSHVTYSKSGGLYVTTKAPKSFDPSWRAIGDRRDIWRKSINNG